LSVPTSTRQRDVVVRSLEPAAEPSLIPRESPKAQVLSDYRASLDAFWAHDVVINNGRHSARDRDATRWIAGMGRQSLACI